ncbi:hypothetical protein [Streptomyces sp. A5-4]|uniref:hypothetical protein n=1 Tax=Streptomyces sp. A5-4 TaxID=3384771 RepID=UPI003DA7F9A7
MDISGARLRTLRAALFTALVVTLSAGSHVLLSGIPLPVNTVAAVGVAVFAVAYALAGRERGFGRIAALLVPLELAADTVFTAGQHVCYGPAGGPVAGPLRAFGVDVLCGGSGVGAPLARVTGSGESVAALLSSPDPALPWLLLGAHVTVGLFAALWLRRGEAALAGLLRATAGFAFRPLLIAAAMAVSVHRTVRRTAPPARRARSSARDRLFVHWVGRRGPPRSAFTLA